MQSPFVSFAFVEPFADYASIREWKTLALRT
jgi:hypothetical protein